MKKKVITFLIMTLVVSNIAFFNASIVHAETIESTTNTDNKIKVSLENIREIMTDNNLDIKMLDNKLKIAREKYQESKDAREDKPSKPNSTDNDNYEEELAEYNKDLANYKASESAYEKAKTDVKTARDNYEKGVESKVLTAQQDYINYLGTLAEKQLQVNTAKSTERDAKLLKIKYESGFISNKEYVNSKITTAESNNTLEKSINDEALQKTKLCNELGVSAEEIMIDTDINEDFMVIAKINYEDDLETMLINNKSIQAASDNIDDLDESDDETDDDSDYTDEVDDYDMDNAKIELKKSKIDAEEKFKTQYNTLMSSYNSTKSSYDKIIQKQKEYQTNQIKYDYGFASKNDTDDAKVTFEKDSNDFIKKRNQCYLDYLKYIQMKEGY